MSKTSNLRPWAVWSTAALTALTISLSPIGTYAAHAATVEVKGTTGAVQTATTTPGSQYFHPCNTRLFQTICTS